MIAQRTFRLPQYYTFFLLLIIFFSAPSLLIAQETSDTSQLETITLKHSSGYRTTSLRIGTALGYGLYRDMGTAPVSFNGLVIQPALGLEFGGFRRWTTSIDLLTSIGFYEDAVAPALNFGSFDVFNTIRFKMRTYFAALFKKKYDSELQLKTIKNLPNDEKKTYAYISAGFTISNFFDVTINPAYENAATGISEFLGPELLLRTDILLGSFFDLDWQKFDKQLHAEVGLMPVAAVMRPGYAYIDNYTASQPVLSALFDEYQWRIKSFAGAYTDIGFDIRTGIGSRISLSYYWSYHTSGNNDVWRFDHAKHLFLIDFTIILKEKRVCLTEISK